MIVLFTDFGLDGPYVGQMKAVLHSRAPNTIVIDLFTDAPAHDPMASSYLLAAYGKGFPEGSIFLSVVDPGVGGGRRAIVVRFGRSWFVGPDNGLVELFLRHNADDFEAWEILWKPPNCSASFHGRDIFSPIAARLACGDTPDMKRNAEDFMSIEVDGIRRPNWPDDLAEIIYFDSFGNAMTGIRSETLKPKEILRIGNHDVHVAETFTDVKSGDMFFYENANGLLEIAVNGGAAKEKLRLKIREKVSKIQL